MYKSIKMLKDYNIKINNYSENKKLKKKKNYKLGKKANLSLI
jgi:hypothetical protein